MRILKCAMNNFYESNSKSRNVLLYILLILYLRRRLMSYIAIAIAFEEPINLWAVLTLVFSDPKFNAMTGLGLLFLTCDICTFSDFQKLVAIRSNKRNWIIGRQLFTVCIVLWYYIFISLCCTLLCLGSCNYGVEWDKAIITISRSDKLSNTLHVHIPSYLPLMCSNSLLCFLFVFVLHSSAGIITVNLLQFISLLINKFAGIIFSGLVVLTDISLELFFPSTTLKYSLWSITRATVLFSDFLNGAKTVSYFTQIFVAGIILSEILCYRCMKKKELF